MDPEAYRQKIERDILDIIEQKLMNGQMDADRAADIAKMVLEKLHPPLTLEQIYAVVPTLDDHFTELAAAVLPVLKDKEDNIRAVVAHHAEALIKSGKFDEADKLLKDATKSPQ